MYSLSQSECLLCSKPKKKIEIDPLAVNNSQINFNLNPIINTEYRLIILRIPVPLTIHTYLKIATLN